MMQFVRVMALMVLFALGAWNAKGQAQQGWTEYDVDGVKWLVQKVDGSEAYRIKPKDETVGDIRIPALIDNKKIVEIAEDAFTRYGGGLTKVTISGGIETIGSKAFKDCKKLKEVTIEGGVKTIAYQAFYGCKSIKSLVIPASVETVVGNENTFSGEGSFEGCDALSSLKIGAQTIGRYAFKGCENLKEVTIEER
ncbi:MAG: leucine-rich repeat domain-containing protein [Bacteroidia bacterium]|nr:leucine-rich repeat domain-containing protein [Bacteroidia bacterium]